MAETPKSPSGVQELIDRLRQDGVRAGRQEAERLLSEAKKQAADILAQARAEAEVILTQAQNQAQTERQAFDEAVKKAFRDTRLELAAQVRSAFTAQVRRLVSLEMEDRNFLRQCLLVLIQGAAATLPNDAPWTIILPADLFTAGEDGPHLTAEGQKHLDDLALGISGETLRKGIVLQPSTALHRGLKVRLVGQDLEIDISDRALGDLLMKYLLPRFQAIVQDAA